MEPVGAGGDPGFGLPIPIEIRPNIGSAATALGADEVGLEIRQRTRARLSAAL